MSEPQAVPSASSCPDEPAGVAAASADGVAQALDKEEEDPKVSHGDSEEQNIQAEKRRRNTISAEKSRLGSILVPEEVMDSMCNQPSGLFFLESHLPLKCTNYDLLAYEERFSRLSDAKYKLEKKAEDENRNFGYISMGYRCPDDDLEKRPSKSSMKVMAVQLGRRLSEDARKWYTSSSVAHLVEDGHSNFRAYTDQVLSDLRKFFQRNPTTELMIAFDSLPGIHRDKEELQNMLELLRTLCTYMISSGSRLKVIVVYNTLNRLWQKFYEHTDSPKDADIRSLCIAHEFDDGDCWLLWPERKKARSLCEKSQ